MTASLMVHTYSAEEEEKRRRLDWPLVKFSNPVLELINQLTMGVTEWIDPSRSRSPSIYNGSQQVLGAFVAVILSGGVAILLR
jgi:hypothetical protein